MRDRLKKWGGQAWTGREDALVRRLYGRIPSRQIGLRLGRSKWSVQHRAKSLGIDAGRCLTPAQRRRVVELYPDHTTREIQEIIGRERHGQPADSTIRTIARCAGLRKCRRYSPRMRERVRQLNAEGLADSQIARRLRIDCVKSVWKMRTSLGLPRNDATLRKIHRRAYLKQMRVLGHPNLGAMRLELVRRFCRDKGWPEDLGLRHVQILELLGSVSGPLPRVEIARRIGAPIPANQRSLLKNGHNSSYLGDLQRLGLVVRLQRALTIHGRGKGRSRDLYTLAPKALDVIIRRNKRCATG